MAESLPKRQKSTNNWSFLMKNATFVKKHENISLFLHFFSFFLGSSTKT